ncbi:hypothetical protein TNCV_3579141 [Trichonephila clavipes]|nr:hypothetical protein TNCV_3579141 [Trichonephila clavipes]
MGTSLISGVVASSSASCRWNGIQYGGLTRSKQVTSEKANFVIKTNQRFIKLTIPELNCPRNLSSTVSGFRMGYFKGMKISPDHSRSFPICKNCPQIQLTPDYIFDCKAILASFFKLKCITTGHLVLKLQIWPPFIIGSFGPL